MFDIKITAIAATAALILGSAGGGYLAYKLTSSHYIEAAQTKQIETDTALREAQTLANKAASNLQYDNAQRVAAASTKYQQDLKNVNNQHARDLANVRSGVLRLRDPGSDSSCSESTTSASGTGTSGRDGTSNGGLSSTASEFLLDFSARANLVRSRLGACQQIVRDDRESVEKYNAALPPDASTDSK